MVSNAFKEECKANVQNLKYGKINIKDTSTNITESDDLQEFEINSNCYVNDKFIGSTVAKKANVKLLDDGEYDLENKEISIKTGVKVSENIEYQDLGAYIIPKPETEEVSSKTEFTGYDYMLKLDVEYIDNNTYPIRMDDYLEKLCQQIGITLGSKSFPNNSYMIKGNPFTNRETCKTVLSNVAQLAAGFAVIDMEDDKLYIKNFDINGDSVETIDSNNYDEFKPNNIFGPVNSVKIQMNSGVEGEETVKEEEGLTDETRCQITVADNYFLISEEERNLVVNNIYNALHGLTYLPIELNYYGYPWLKIGDKIKVKDKNDNEYTTYVMEHDLKWNGAYSGTIKVFALTKTQSAYSETVTIQKWKRNTELKVDKIEGNIESVVQEQTETNERLTETVQTVEEITDTVKEVQENTEQSINEIKETSDAFSIAISKVGGDNLIKNSAMINEKNFWFSAIKNAYTESETPPENQVEGDYWYCTADYAGYVANQMYVYQSGTWIQSNYTRKGLNNLLNLLENVSSNEYLVDGTKTSEKSFSGRALMFDGKNDFSVTHIFCVGEPISLNDTEEYIIYSYSIKNNISLGVAYIGVMFLETDQFTPVEIPYSIYEPAIIYTPDDAKNLTKIEQKIKIPKKEDFIEVVASQTELEDSTNIWLDTTINLPKQYNTETSMWEILNTTMSLYEHTTRHVWTYRGIFGSYYETPVNFDDMQIKSFFPAVTFYPSFSVYTGDTEPMPQKGLYWNNQTTDLVKRAKYGKQLNEETGEQEEVFEEWETIPIPSSMLPTGDIIALPQIPYIVPLQGFFEVLDLKLEYNVVATNWTQYPGEVYTKNYKMDERGFSIESGQNIMFIDEDEILATYKGLNIFQINKDLAYFKKIEVDESINIGDFTLKQQTINSKKFLLLY